MKRKSVPIAAVLSENIQALLREHGWSKRKLSQHCGVSDRYIATIITQEHRPTAEVVQKIAEAFGIQAWELMLPGLAISLAKTGVLSDLILDFMRASESARAYILTLLQREAAA